VIRCSHRCCYWGAWRALAEQIRTLGRLSVPIAATYGSEAGFFSVAALLIGSFGVSALAAHTAVNQLVYIVFQMSVGLSHAASIGVSSKIAVGRTEGARRIGRTAFIHAAIVVSAVGCVYLTVPTLVLRPFFEPGEGPGGDALAIASNLLLVAVVLQFLTTRRTSASVCSAA
jgi:multidrug resistance protein, MATE family